MKHFLLLLLLPLCFYGQDIDSGTFYRKGYIVNKGCYLFYEIEENVLLAPVLVEFDSSLNVDKIDLLTIYHDPKGDTDNALIKILGKKIIEENFECDGLSYEKLYVSEIMPTTFTLDDFILTTGHIKKELEEEFEGEGFYSKGFEHSAFTVLKDGKLKSAGYLTFTDNILENKSLDRITYYKYPEMKRGVYMKVRGIKKYGSVYGYGWGGSYELHVSEILSVDTTKTRFDFINQKLKNDGNYIYRNDTLHSPRLPEQGKDYLFKGRLGKYTVALKLKRINNADINYTLEYYKGKKLVEKIDGLLSADLFGNLGYYIQSGGELLYKYESNDDKYKDGHSFITFTIYDLPEKITFGIEDEYGNTAKGRYIDLTQVSSE